MIRARQCYPICVQKTAFPLPWDTVDVVAKKLGLVPSRVSVDKNASPTGGGRRLCG
jgi:hypothetical protein